MMNRSARPNLARTHIALALLTACAGSGFVFAQPSSQSRDAVEARFAGGQENKQEAQQDGERPERPRPMLRALIERRTPEELKLLLDRKAESLREQLKAIEDAQAMLSQQKPAGEIADRLSQTSQLLILDTPETAAMRQRLEQQGAERAGAERGGPDRNRPGKLGALREGPEREGPEREGERRGPAEARAQRRELLELVRNELPSVYEKLENLREKEPVMAERIADRLLPRVRDAAMIRAEDPELFQLRMKEIASSVDVLAHIRGLRDATKAQPADDAAIASAREKLKAALTQNFDEKLAIGKAEVARTDARKKQVQDRIDHATANRDALIEEAMRDIEAGRMPKAAFDPDGRGPRGNMRGERPREGERDGDGPPPR